MNKQFYILPSALATPERVEALSETWRAVLLEVKKRQDMMMADAVPMEAFITNLDPGLKNTFGRMIQGGLIQKITVAETDKLEWPTMTHIEGATISRLALGDGGEKDEDDTDVIERNPE